jgi:geranylgeranyl diphosphate synthase, type I
MSGQSFERFIALVRGQVDERLAGWLEPRVAAARVRGDDVGAVAEAVSTLALRGGKRLRAALLAASYVACDGQGGAPAVALAGVALELLQTYLLVHDDWMDGDDVRRGGPSVPALLRARSSEHADAASVLAGDLACAWAQQALLELDLPAPRVLQAAREMAQAQEDVVQGQVLDVCSLPGDWREVEAVHALKTASYTVRAPVLMGARLAGAPEARVAALGAFAAPLGIAFQLRDDVLGTFGDPRATGKPAGSDLRKGKRTALALEASRDERAARAMTRMHGLAESTGVEELAEAIAAIEASGARAQIEERIEALVHDAKAALADAELPDRDLLEGAIVALTRRER